VNTLLSGSFTTAVTLDAIEQPEPALTGGDAA
jgi:hypothetical protein